MDEIEKAAEILKIGGIIAYPTETLYGIGANIFNDQAVTRVFETKFRNFNQPLSVAVSSFDMLEKITYLNKEQRKKIRELLPGPITILLPKKEIVSNIITGGKEKVGIRFPESKTSKKIIDKNGFPIISTSANLTGEQPPTKPEDITINVDFIIKTGKEECKYKKPSTILDLVEMKILREGAGVKKVKDILNI